MCRLIISPLTKQLRFITKFAPVSGARKSPGLVRGLSPWIDYQQERAQAYFEKVFPPLTNSAAQSLGVVQRVQRQVRIWSDWYLKNRVPPNETTLKQIHQFQAFQEPGKPDQIFVEYDADLEKASKFLHKFGRHAERSYRWRYVSMAFIGVPISSLFSLLPLPNVVLFWALFRMFSNRQSWLGARTLLRWERENLIKWKKLD